MTNSVPQIPSDSANCGDRQMALYEAIRERIAQSFFSRSHTDEDELLHVIFVNLVDTFLPPFGSDELTKLLNDEIAHTIRKFRRNTKSTLDIDTIDPDEEPSYDMQANADEEEFEKMFDRFCDSHDEPERTIFRRSRTHTRLALANCTGISRNDVARILKSMPKKFEKFVKNFLE